MNRWEPMMWNHLSRDTAKSVLSLVRSSFFIPKPSLQRSHVHPRDDDAPEKQSCHFFLFLVPSAWSTGFPRARPGNDTCRGQERSVRRWSRWAFLSSIKHEQLSQCPLKRDSCLRIRETRSISAFSLKNPSLRSERSLAIVARLGQLRVGFFHNT